MTAKAAIRNRDLDGIIRTLAKRGLTVGRIVVNGGEVQIFPTLTGAPHAPSDGDPSAPWDSLYGDDS